MIIITLVLRQTKASYDVKREVRKLISSQPAITCSKLTIETLEQGV